jgi:hypothetical protein
MPQRDSAQKYLEKLYTRQLLKLRDRAYRVCNFNGNLPRNPFVNVTDSLTVRVSEIRRELSKREHIPNKAEAKKIRQEKAKKR